ncbi:MAG TPA: RraA family protein [Acidimicrobiia bacterium]|nr:RraA family protein [Acidimicrobiia bacterium]
MNDSDLRARLSTLHTALLCDVMDGLGFRTSAFDKGIRPIESNQKLAGPAFTIRCQAVDKPPEEPYQQLLAAFAELRAGDVIVLQCGDQVSAMWGELLSTAAVAKGAVGAVMDGATRDVQQILELGFPVFSCGFSPLDSAGRQEVIDYDVEVECGNIRVRPRDWIMGDIMGVIVIPAELVEQAVTLAVEKDAGESTVRDELLRGDEIGEVFARHGIL